MQGDFDAHRRALEQAGAQAVEVRTAADLAALEGMVIPGGESTTMLKLLEVENLFDKIAEFGRRKPIFGTCAGAILLASEVKNPQQASLGLIDLMVERNAYGRQVDSRIAEIELDGRAIEAVFIRAPIIRRVGPDTKVLSSYNGTAVLVENNSHMVSTFHPELTADVRVHRHFVAKVASRRS